MRIFTFIAAAFFLAPHLSAQDGITFENSSSSLKMIKMPSRQNSAADYDVADVLYDEPAAAPPKAQPQKPPPAPPPAAAAQKKPKIPRDDIKWSKRPSGNFDIFSQPRTTGVPTANLNLRFETVHQTLRRNIPWLVAGKSDVFVYQNRADFLKHEPQAMNWSSAFFSPAENCIVMYDDPKNIDNIIAQFTHELTHLFVESYFNPPSAAYKAEAPIWFNEGLAVNMEDMSANYKGGVWAGDLAVINILPAPAVPASDGRARLQPAAQGRPSYPGGPRISDTTVYFRDFGSFMRDDSYDKAVAGNYVEDWYFQAYAMIRFLFKPFNAQYPEKRMQFEQLTKQLKNYDAARGARVSSEAALKSVYGFKDAAAFEAAFYKWLYDLQKTERAKILQQQST